MNKKQQVLQAIKQKYGKEALIDPRMAGPSIPEDELREQLAESDKKITKALRENEKVLKNGYLVSKSLVNRDSCNRVCPECKTFSFSAYDDVYMLKFKCCFECYVQYVEGREEKWFQKLKDGENKNEQKENGHGSER